MKQYGFFIDISRCTGCNACVISCKQWNNISPGPAKPIRVHQWEKGAFPNIDVNVFPIMCFHCEHPACADACENGAIFKEEKYGAVLVDKEKCKGDRNCYAACPYGSPQFLSDDPSEKMLKCDMCISRLEEGKAPQCVLSCSLRALDFGPLEELRARYGDEGCFIAQNEPPCKTACPAGVNVQDYVTKIEIGRIDDALSEYYKITPFAGVLGRVCTHPCEISCFRGRFDDAVSARELKRYMADDASTRGFTPEIKVKPHNNKKIAIVGSGPSGLSCAYSLVKEGFSVTVFEEAPLPGGMMRYAIPSYRLPKNVLSREIKVITNLGVEIKCKSPINDLSALKDYDAVYVATGAGASIPLSVEGSNLQGVKTALNFLKTVNSEQNTKLSGNVAVIGGGSVAVDAARTAIRAGASTVHLICLECSDFRDVTPVPAQEEEIEGARHEGVIIHDKRGIASFSGNNGHVNAVVTVPCISVFNDCGCFCPEYDSRASEKQVIPVDTVLLALGQYSPASAFPAGLPLNDLKKVDKALNFRTSKDNIFAGGDLLTGTADIISAIAQGNEAAESIRRFCFGENVEASRRPIVKSSRLHIEKKSCPGEQPKITNYAFKYDEATLCYSNIKAEEQSSRCLHCGKIVPSALIRRDQPKKNIVPWDKIEALELWSTRCPDEDIELPKVIDNINDVLENPDLSIFGRNRLNLKPKNSEEKLFFTTDDE